MLRTMNAKARAAISIQDGSPSMVPALASAAIIRPFQSASTLSSSPGRTRLLRSIRSLSRSMASRASSSGAAR